MELDEDDEYLQYIPAAKRVDIIDDHYQGGSTPASDAGLFSIFLFFFGDHDGSLY